MIKTLKELAENATPGPWVHDTDGWCEPAGGCFVNDIPAIGKGVIYPSEDVAYIAAANPETILKMIAVIEAATEVKDHYYLLGCDGDMSVFQSDLSEALKALEVQHEVVQKPDD